MTTRPLFKKHDVLILAALLLLAVILYALNTRAENKPAGRISVNGQAVQTVELSKDAEFALEQNPAVRFEVRGGAAAFIESSCPDKICINSGFLRYPGQTAVCLPNRVSLIIVGDAEEHGADTYSN